MTATEAARSAFEDHFSQPNVRPSKPAAKQDQPRNGYCEETVGGEFTTHLRASHPIAPGRVPFVPGG
jgi:hypothetical protein